MTVCPDDPHALPGEGDRVEATMSTPVGPITLTANGRSVIGVEWCETDIETNTEPATEADTESEPATEVDAGAERDAVDHGTVPADPLLAEALRQLRGYFAGTVSIFDLPLDLGPISETARIVLTTLDDTVESGTTVTYGELARRSGTGILARAIGTIMGMNPLPLLIACHRVVAGEGLGGYSGGRRGTSLATKRWLLEFENALPPTLF